MDDKSKAVALWLKGKRLATSAFPASPDCRITHATDWSNCCAHLVATARGGEGGGVDDRVLHFGITELLKIV